MKQKILFFDGASLETKTVDAPGRLRWATWTPARHEESALIAGDRGALFSYARDRFSRVQTHTTQNLRCVEFSPDGATALVSGNNGTLLRTTLTSAEPLRDNDARDNLRRIGWNRTGEVALVVGNGGAAYALEGRAALRRVHGAETNLRSVAWHPREDRAIVCGNCFQYSAGGLTPSPNLFMFTRGEESVMELRSFAESRADLTSARWRPDGSRCLLVGYDQTWHTPDAFNYAQGSLHHVAWEGRNVFPTSCSWHPSGRYALIGTSLMHRTEGECALYRYDSDSATVAKLSDLGAFGVSCIAWSPDGLRAIVTGSTSTRAFSA